MEAGRLAVAVLVGQAGMMGTGTGATAVGRGWILDRVSRKSQEALTMDWVWCIKKQATVLA